MMFYEPGRLDRSRLAHDPFQEQVAPCPIGWVSTTAADRSINLAPYSFFNAVAEAPPMQAFSSHGAKHSGLWQRDVGGVRFEYLSLVTDGCELLTDFPYSLTLEGR